MDLLSSSVSLKVLSAQAVRRHMQSVCKQKSQSNTICISFQKHLRPMPGTFQSLGLLFISTSFWVLGYPKAGKNTLLTQL